MVGFEEVQGARLGESGMRFDNLSTVGEGVPISQGYQNQITVSLVITVCRDRGDVDIARVVVLPEDDVGLLAGDEIRYLEYVWLRLRVDPGRPRGWRQHPGTSRPKGH